MQTYGHNVEPEKFDEILTHCGGLLDGDPTPDHPGRGTRPAPASRPAAH